MTCGGEKCSSDDCTEEEGSGIFQVIPRLQIPAGSDEAESLGVLDDECRLAECMRVRLFDAVVAESVGEEDEGLKVMVAMGTNSDHLLLLSLTSSESQFKVLPWLEDRPVAALRWDSTGDHLFVATGDGTLFEIPAASILGNDDDDDDADLVEICHLAGVNILSLHPTPNADPTNFSKPPVLLVRGDSGKLIILTHLSPPVLVTFTSLLENLEVFQHTRPKNSHSIFISLQSGQNVTASLEDLELLELQQQQQQQQGKKSLFRKAKENIFSRLEDRFSNKKSSTSVQQQMEAKSPSLMVSRPPTGPVPPHSLKFVPVEDPSAKVGVLRQIPHNHQQGVVFFRHSQGSKLDLFDNDLRQTASVYVPPQVHTLFPTGKLYFSLEELDADNTGGIGVFLVRVSVVVDSVLCQFASIELDHRLLGVVPTKSMSVFYLVTEGGVIQVQLRQTPLEVLRDLTLRESPGGGSIVDALCGAFGVGKSAVLVAAGDRRAQEGKFSKTIIYYKTAGLSYSQICAKFGSRGQIAAMLFFYELVDQERSKSTTSPQDQQVMADLALLGRVEQYLRQPHQTAAKTDDNKKAVTKVSPGQLLRRMLVSCHNYSSPKAARYLAIPELLWAMRTLGRARKCHPDILACLCENADKIPMATTDKRPMNLLLSSDWLALYSCPPAVVAWLRTQLIPSALDDKSLKKLLVLLTPWRRELQRKVFVDVSIEGEGPAKPLWTLDNFVALFLELLLEAVRRVDKKDSPSPSISFPDFVYKPEARVLQKQEVQNHRTNMVATLMLSYSFSCTFAAAPTYCIAVRNGRVFAWGENRMGKLGIGEERTKAVVDTPTPIAIPNQLKIQIESVAAGSTHAVALTNVGTVLTWGSNRYGQLGIGCRGTQWVGRPLPVNLTSAVITCIAAGGYHCVAVDHLNRVWVWGWGLFGQLGLGDTENRWRPHLLSLEEKIVFASAGHSHTALLTCFGRVLVFGCNHFGQLGLGGSKSSGSSQGKVKTPTHMDTLPQGTLVRLVECGICSTVVVTTRNRLFYCGLNPASLKSLLNGANRRKGGIPTDPQQLSPEDKDFAEPTMIDTAHMAGDITKVSCSSTHFGVLTSLGYVYTWGLGKSGQLARADDDSRTLELIDSDAGSVVAADICCAGDCSFVVERDTGHLFGCGFNSNGQLGRLETDLEQSLMTVRTNKRVVKIRQPSNIHFRLREITGLPKQMAWEGESAIINNHRVKPESNLVSQQLLLWALKVLRPHYHLPTFASKCVEIGNLAAASALETLSENHEEALRHALSSGENHSDAANTYVSTLKTPSLEQVVRFVLLLVGHWGRAGLPGNELETLLDRCRGAIRPPGLLNLAIKEVVAGADDSAEWMAAHLTPLFILGALQDASADLSPPQGSSDSSPTHNDDDDKKSPHGNHC